MATFLQAIAAQQATRTMFDKARAAAKKAPGDKVKAAAVASLAASLTAAYTAAIDAAAGQPALAKQRDGLIEAKVVHREKYEKVTTETADPPSKEPASEEAAAPETTPSQEEEPSSSAAASMPAPAPKKGKRAAEPEKDEEEAIAAAYVAGAKGYRGAMRGQDVDAYGAKYGPQALLTAVQKALGTSSIRETFGALAGLPEKLAAHAEVASRVERLERNDLKGKIDALVLQAKLEGRTRGKEDRVKLRAFGMKHGAEELKGTLKMRDARRPDAHKAPAGEGDRAGAGDQNQGDDAIDAAIAEALAGIPKEQRAEFEKMMRANLAAQNAVVIPAA